MEDKVTAAVEQLSRDLRGAQQTLRADQENGKGGLSDKTAQALAEVRQLRQMLERSQQRNNSGGPGQGSRDNSPQPGTPQPGAQDGKEGSLSEGNGRGELSRRELQDAIGQISALRGQISGEDRALGNYFGGTLGYLRDLNADPSVLQATIGQDAITSLERLEAELSRRLGEQQTQGARSGATDATSEKYRDAVAEYFKKLSQTPHH